MQLGNCVEVQMNLQSFKLGTSDALGSLEIDGFKPWNLDWGARARRCYLMIDVY